MSFGIGTIEMAGIEWHQPSYGIKEIDHPRRFRIGVPHRIGYLEQLYDYVLSHEDVLVWTGEEILDWFLAQQRDNAK